MNIALALSGGGYRATVFHLGVLARLAEQKRLEEVTFVSSVSGGSLCAGMVFALNAFQWPSSEEFINKVLPETFQILTTQDFQLGLVGKVLGSLGSFFDTRADNLSELINEKWGVNIKLSELPKNPRWLINSTCYESGKNFRFERFRMGDYVFGYSYDTDKVKLSDAMAASAGFPGLIGALELDANQYSWFKYDDKGDEELALMDEEFQKSRKTKDIPPLFPEAHLWDGGVYDNHGLEGLHNYETGWRKGIDFMVVSDAAGRSSPEEYHIGIPAIQRIMTGIMMDQIRSLRSRAILERIVVHKDGGVFLQNGNSCKEIFTKAGKLDLVTKLCPGCLDEEDAERAGKFGTVIRKLSEEEFKLLFRHGFEVADCTLLAYQANDFEYIGYSNARSKMVIP